MAKDVVDLTGGKRFIKLNVGGKAFATRRATLCCIQTSLLAKTFSTLSDAKSPDWIVEIGDNHYFIDRNPIVFDSILSHLREAVSIGGVDPDHWDLKCASEDTTYVSLLKLEAKFFGLTSLENRCHDFLNRCTHSHLKDGHSSAVLAKRRKSQCHPECTDCHQCVKGAGRGTCGELVKSVKRTIDV